MKIQYIVGDLFDTDCCIIAHGCNAQGVMGSGVARIVRDWYPEAYEDYRRIADSEGLQLGRVYVTMSKTKLIANMITQDRFGADGKRYVSYDAVAMACESLDKLATKLKIDRVAMPQIGAGLGGGDWKVIEAIIQASFKHTQPVVYLLEPLTE